MSEKKMMKNGKKLGVVGGLGPAAAAEFLRQFTMRCPANCDQEHPVVYMIGDCDIPDRGTAIFGKGESPLPKLKADLLLYAPEQVQVNKEEARTSSNVRSWLSK